MDQNHLLFADSDVDAMQGLLNTYLEPGSVRLDPRPPVAGELRLSLAGPKPQPDDPAPALLLHQMDVGPDLEMQAVERLDAYSVCVGRFGRNDVAIDGRLAESGLLVSSPGQDIRSHYTASSSLVLRITREAIEEALSSRLGDTPGRPLQFDSELLPDRPGVGAWIQLLQSFWDSSVSGLFERSPLAAHHFEQTLVHGLLDVQPHTHIAELERDRSRLRSSHLRKAIEFCEQNAAAPLSVADIAAAATTGIRTLQRSFQDEFQMAPMEYVRQIRLDRARAELLDIRWGIRADTVSDVALRWGFTHLGRFSRSYRKRFGENPSTTVRSAQ
ncbi:AraC family transcriptional regulator [Actinomycetes bacterium KLBMP 9759]